MKIPEHDARPTVPAPPPTTTPMTMIVVVDDLRHRLAIMRSFPHCVFHFASTVEEAESLAQTGLASTWYVF